MLERHGNERVAVASRAIPNAPVIRVSNPDREPDFPGLLDQLQPALEARHPGHGVQIGRETAAQAFVVIHDVSDGETVASIRGELDRIDPDWSSWVFVEP